MLVTGITKKVGKFLRENETNLSELSRATGIPYSILYASVWDKNRTRELRVDEFFSICEFLGVKVEDFAQQTKQESV